MRVVMADEISGRPRKTTASREGRGSVELFMAAWSWYQDQVSVKDGGYTFKCVDNVHLATYDRCIGRWEYKRKLTTISQYR